MIVGNIAAKQIRQNTIRFVVAKVILQTLQFFSLKLPSDQVSFEYPHHSEQRPNSAGEVFASNSLPSATIASKRARDGRKRLRPSGYACSIILTICWYTSAGTI